MPAGIARGGKAVYGAALGILMLEARFPRIPGDVGHAGTWRFPVHYHVVPGAAPQRVVREQATGLLQVFIDGARELVRRGADGITTNCGFLSLFQQELAEAVPVPVASSSLMQVALVRRMLPQGRKVGVITIDSASLTAEHLARAGVPDDTPVEGTEGGSELTRVILGDEPELDMGRAMQDMIEAGERLRQRCPDLGAIVLECTNMCPYSAGLAAQLGLPVFDMVSFIEWFHTGLVPRHFAAP